MRCPVTAAVNLAATDTQMCARLGLLARVDILWNCHHGARSHCRQSHYDLLLTR